MLSTTNPPLIGGLRAAALRTSTNEHREDANVVCKLGPTVMMRINQKLSPSAFLGIATNKQSRVPTVLRFTDSRGESWCLIFAKEMRLSNVLFENDACFNPHLLTWDPARAKENRVRATLFACLYQQGLEHGWAWRFSDKIVGVCLVFHFYPRIRKEHTDKSCLIPAKLFMSAIRSVS